MKIILIAAITFTSLFYGESLKNRLLFDFRTSSNKRFDYFFAILTNSPKGEDPITWSCKVAMDKYEDIRKNVIFDGYELLSDSIVIKLRDAHGVIGNRLGTFGSSVFLSTLTYNASEWSGKSNVKIIFPNGVHAQSGIFTRDPEFYNLHLTNVIYTNKLP